MNLPDPFRALVIGATGAIGAAFVALLETDPRCAAVVSLHRHSQPAIDFDDEASIAKAAAELAQQAPFHLIINAAGKLHTPDFMPEKKLGDLNYAQMEETFRTNAFGPALVLRHFSALLEREGSAIVTLSAKVGSIEDNRLGGWYSYRASKAALNMFIKTASIELKRTKSNTVVIAMHPGTVSSKLSAPYRGAEIGRTPDVAAAEMFAVITQQTSAASGSFLSYSGEVLPW